MVYDYDNRVRPDIICKDQIGFIKGAGTDVNLLKLMVRCREAKEKLKRSYMGLSQCCL